MNEIDGGRESFWLKTSLPSRFIINSSGPVNLM